MSHDETIVEILWALALPAVIVGCLVIGGRFLVAELRLAGVLPVGPEFPLGFAAVGLCLLATVWLLGTSHRRARGRDSSP
jgi:hypothetical protein